MENYRMLLKRRIRFLLIPVFICVALGIYDVFYAPLEIKENLIFEFQTGIVVGLEFLFLFVVWRYTRILNDDKKLRMLFNQENDERRKAIKAKAGLPMILVTSLAMILAGIIIGYFNITVFYALVGGAVCQMAVVGVVKLLYTQRM